MQHVAPFCENVQSTSKVAERKPDNFRALAPVFFFHNLNKLHFSDWFLLWCRALLSRCRL